MKEYLYDPHTHTAETSKCGHLPAAEVVDRYAGHGFSGLVVTDHLHPEYLSRIDTDHNWDHVIDHYLAGYRPPRPRGRRTGAGCDLGRSCASRRTTTTIWSMALTRRGCGRTHICAA